MPVSQQELSDEYVAALTAADIPPEDADWDPEEADSGRPAELAGLPAEDLAELLAAQPERGPGPVPAGCWTRCRPGRCWPGSPPTRTPALMSWTTTA